MRRYAAHPQNNEALDWLHGCKLISRILIAAFVVLPVLFYLIPEWDNTVWVYQVGGCVLGSVLSVWQVYLVFPRMMLKKYLHDGSILQLISAITRVRWCWNEQDVVKVRPGNRYHLQRLYTEMPEVFDQVIRLYYFRKRPAEVAVERLRTQGEAF